MTAISGTGDFGRRFAAALGLDPRKTRTITVNVPADGVVIATVEMFVQEEEFEQLIVELKKYELHEIEKEEVE